MADTASPPLGSGDHGREFPPLPAERRAAIIASFSASNQRYFSGTMGFVVVDLRAGYARLTADNTTAHQQPAGVMHGGASFGLADTAVAAALFTIYGFEQLLLTIEMKINYLEPIPPGEVIAEAYVLRSSRRSAYAEVDIWAAGKLAARATTTYMVKPLPAAAPSGAA
ncbi:MAG: PaaI family thioesterase [Deltaproteobacteria bacterium]|nr:PaaI family thioesterase [Deltaproteobacteria bacterium]